jgi:hypothetical protein
MTMKKFFAKQHLRRRTLVVTLGLAAAVSMVAGRERPAVEVVEARAPAISAAASPDLDLARLERRDAGVPQADPFATRSFAPQPPPVQQAAARAAAPEAPTAPPLPFVYIGRVTQNGKTDVYVMRGDELIDITAGRKIDEEYRVDAIGETSIAFTYLPLKMRQSLELPEASG